MIAFVSFVPDEGLYKVRQPVAFMADGMVYALRLSVGYEQMLEWA